MLRCALIMLLCPLLQNGTLATLEEWAASCPSHFKIISSLGSISLDKLSNIPNINYSLDLLLDKVNTFPIKGMEELLSRRLKKPLEIAISNCEEILNEVEHSGHEGNKKYLESLLSKIHSIPNGIGKEFNTFIMEVELELIKKVNWTSGNKKKLEHTFSNLYELAKHKQSYCDPESFNRAAFWVSRLGRPQYVPGTPEFVEYLGTLILNAKLKILETEFNSKIAGFAQQQPLIDGDGFMAFSHYFKLEWKLIEQMIGQLTSNDDKDTFRKRLDNLAEKKAMEETAPLKAIISENFDQLITKCQNSSGKFNEEEASNQRVAAANGMGPSKNVFKDPGSNKSNQNKQKEQNKQTKQKEQKEEDKNKEIDAMKEFISGIGMFDGAADKLLVRFEHEELGNTDFCAELEKAVKEDKKMISNAYKVHQVIQLNVIGQLRTDASAIPKLQNDSKISIELFLFVLCALFVSTNKLIFFLLKLKFWLIFGGCKFQSPGIKRKDTSV